ncbi:unnamed protein product [Rotaria sordida]|uniref:G-protein coupled receptors family 1 profile domain-containing protein n=1 Tax=Rotaria sordida TaxID=392033 RepID=A0A813VT44_9BILA|nr:unnamed protein product [Rotaria sordida]
MTNKSNSMPTLVVVEQYMSIYGPFILTALGIIGNTLSILIFLSPRYRRQSSHFYLLSLALSDLCFLIINLLEDTFRNHNELYKSRINFLDRSSSIICILAQYTRNVTRLLSSWIIVSFTIERLLVVFHPLQRGIICRRKIARLVVIILFIITLICNINVPFHYGIISVASHLPKDTICDILPDYRRIYMRFAITTMIAAYLLPMCIIGFVNMLICCKLWKNSSIVEKSVTGKVTEERHDVYPSSQRSSAIADVLACMRLSSRSPSSSSSFETNTLPSRRYSSPNHYQLNRKLLKHNKRLSQGNGYLDIETIRERSRSPSRSLSNYSTNFPNQSKSSVISVKAHIQSRTHRVTATLLLVSCSFLLLNTPYCAVWIANYVHDFNNMTLKSIKEITELFMLTNFCINFLLYCVSGKVFRSELICLLRCHWKELYDRNECERMIQRKHRQNLEIQLNERKSKSQYSPLHQNNQQRPLTISSSAYSKQMAIPKWEWNKVVNTDFSGIFTIESFHNSKNDVIYAEDSSEFPANLRGAPMLKYPNGVMFWSGICTRGLILHDGPNNFIQWLQDQYQNDKHKRMYMTEELYARFLREEVIPAINEVVRNLDGNDGDTKFADVWLIENIWGIMEEKTRGKTFENLDALVDFVSVE